MIVIEEKQKSSKVSFVEQKSKEGEDWAVLRQIQINRSYYKGNQWIAWDRVKKNIYIPELRPGEKRLTFNKIRPHILTLLSKMCKNRVKLEVKPDTNDIERIEVAKAGFKYLNYQWDIDDMNRKTRRLKLHMLVDGSPALKVFVDRKQGQDIPKDAVPSDLAADMKLPEKTGKICTQVVDQFALKVDPNAEDITEIRWALEERPTHIDDIKEEWGVEVEKEDIAPRQTFEIGQTTDIQKKYDNHAMVYDYWEFPCAKYPNGRRIVVAGGQELLYDEKDPGENPFIFFPAIPIPGRAIGEAVVSDMTTAQRSYNIKRTAEARILEEMGNPMWLSPGGVIDDDELVNEIGAIVHYTPNQQLKPERVPGVEPGNGWQNAMERDEADMEDISGAHEISQGATPRGNNTLGGLQLQLEQDETKLALFVQSYEDGIKQWGEKVLRLVQKHFPEEQQLSIVGENGEIEAFTFSGADLTGNEVVDVVPGSSMPTLKAVQDEKVMAMWGAGMFNDPRTGAPDTRRVVRMLGESIAAQYFDDTEQDENKALMENRTWQQVFSDPEVAQLLVQYQQEMMLYQQAQSLAQGMDIGPAPQPPVKLPIVRDFYDHQIHIEAHNRFRKSDDYDNLPPQMQALVDQHVAEHEQYLLAPQIEAQQQQIAMQQQQEESQSKEADKNREHQRVMKQDEQAAKMEQESMRAQVALATANMRGANRQ